MRTWILATALLVAASTLPTASTQTLPHLLLITVDTLRADHLGAYGYRGSTSPAIDALARAGLRFEEALTPLPMTDPSHASFLTGLHPLRHGVLTNAMSLPAQVDSVAELLQARGYSTAAVVAVEHLGSRFHFNQGFDRFDDTWTARQYQNDDHQRTAPAVNADAEAVLEEHAARRSGRPLFLWVHYFDPHWPYLERTTQTPRAPRRSDPLTRVIAAYDAEVSYVDQHIGRLLDRARKLGMANNLVTVVSADHGEQLGDHGLVGLHADIYRETVRIPLIVHGPGIQAAVVTTPVSAMDVAPTLLGRAGIRFATPVDGIDLLQSAAQPVHLPEREFLIVGPPDATRSAALVKDRSWYIRNFDHVYRQMVVAQLPPRRSNELFDAGYRELTPTVVEKDRAVFAIARLDVSPVMVSLDIAARNPSCAPTVTVTLQPRERYLDSPITASPRVRIAFPVGRLERSVVEVAPAHCLGPVYARYEPFQRFWAEPTGAAPTRTTDLFQRFLSPRKHHTSDELFNVTDDPAMTRNLLTATSNTARVDGYRLSMDRLITVGLKQSLAASPLSDPLTARDLRLLRSLGYIR